MPDSWLGRVEAIGIDITSSGKIGNTRVTKNSIEIIEVSHLLLIINSILFEILDEIFYLVFSFLLSLKYMTATRRKVSGLCQVYVRFMSGFVRWDKKLLERILKIG